MLVQLVFRDPACEAAYGQYSNASCSRLDTVGLLLQLICCLTCFSKALRGSAPASTTAHLAIATSALAILTLSACVCLHRNRAAWPARRRLIVPLLRIVRFGFLLFAILVIQAVPPCLPSDPPTHPNDPPFDPHPAFSPLHFLVPISGHTVIYSLLLRVPDPLHASLAFLEAATLSALLSPAISTLLPPATVAAPAYHHLSTLTSYLRPPVPRLAPIPPNFRPPPASTPSLLLHILSPSLLLLSCLLSYLSKGYHRAAFAHTLPPHKLGPLYLHLLPRSFLAVALAASFLPVVHDSCVLLHTFPASSPATWLLVATICILEAFMRLWVWVLLFSGIPSAARLLLAAPHQPPQPPPGSDEDLHTLAPSETSSAGPPDPPAASAAPPLSFAPPPAAAAAAAAAAAGPSGISRGEAGRRGEAKENGGLERSDVRRCSDAVAAAPERGSRAGALSGIDDGGIGR